LRIKGIPQQSTEWVGNFFSGRKTTISIDRTTSQSIEIEAVILQGSPISPILYLFSNALLLEACSGTSLKAPVGGFVDSVYILAYENITQDTCQMLGRLHERCLEYVARHGASFSFERYELIHFTRNATNFDTNQGITIECVAIAPKPHIRVLELELDTKLRWKAHLAKVEDNTMQQTLALTCQRLAASEVLRQGRGAYTR
jgi:hypothetical protein